MGPIQQLAGSQPAAFCAPPTDLRSASGLLMKALFGALHPPAGQWAPTPDRPRDGHISWVHIPRRTNKPPGQPPTGLTNQQGGGRSQPAPPPFVQWFSGPRGQPPKGSRRRPPSRRSPCRWCSSAATASASRRQVLLETSPFKTSSCKCF